MVWMGVKILPIAGATVGDAVLSMDEKAIRKWANDDPEFRRIFSVAIPDDTVVYQVEKVPETTRLVQVHPLNGEEAK
jgi:hypothetical protein